MQGDDGAEAVFRSSPRQSGQIALISAALLALAILALALDPDALAGPGAVWKAALAIGGVGSLTVVFALLWRRPPVVLRVGPAGLMLPVGFRRPLGWGDIRAIRLEQGRGVLFERRIWLVVEVRPGILPDYRLPGPRWLEHWRLRHFGLRIPLHALDAPASHAVAAVERHFPVWRRGAQ